MSFVGRWQDLVARIALGYNSSVANPAIFQVCWRIIVRCVQRVRKCIVCYKRYLVSYLKVNFFRYKVKGSTCFLETNEFTIKFSRE